MDNSIIDTVNETMNRNEQSIKTTRIIITGASLLNGINKERATKGYTSPKMKFSIKDSFSKCDHGTIIRTVRACNKIPCYMPAQLAGGVLLKKLKYFEVMLNIFEFSPV